MKVTHWRNLREVEHGTERDLTWDELCELLSRRRRFQGTNSHPGWSPAEFTGLRRSGDTVTRVWALTLDHDAGEPIDAVAGRLDGLARLLHTTRKHTPEAPRCRVVVPLSRPVSPFEYAALWKRFAPFAGEIDPAPKDPSRFWFLPGCPDDAEFVAERFEGEPLDVDHWLAKPDPESVAAARASVAMPSAPADVYDRARSYVAKMPEAVAGSGGHQATWAVALVLARGFGLSESDAYSILANDYNPRCQPPWSEKELRHKLSGATRANVEHGWLLKDDRRQSEWRSEDTSTLPREPEAELEVREANPEASRPPSLLEQYQVTNLRSALVDLWERAKTREPVKGFTTGCPTIDAMTGGLVPGHVVVLGAASSFGKSSFGVMVADENIKRGNRVLVVSVEDDETGYAQRIAARRGGFNALDLRDNKLGDRDIAELGVLASRAEDVPFVMRAIGRSAEWAAAGITALVRSEGIDVVVCDYLQRFKVDAKQQDTRNRVTYALACLSDAIKNSGAAGLVMSQLKRNEGRAPTMDDLKESGDIEIMAEAVLLGHRVPKPQEAGKFTQYERFMYVAKNKFGPVMAEEPLELVFNDLTASFVGEKPDPYDHYTDDFASPPDYIDP